MDKGCSALLMFGAVSAPVVFGYDWCYVCRDNNVVSNSPHPADEVLSDKWDKPYSRELAAYPAAWCRQAKFWPTTSRVDNVYGDKNLVSRLPEASTAFAVAVGE